MKTRIYTISLLTLALLVSCQNREEAPAIDKTFKLIAVQDNGAESKTVISGERSVYWEPAEEIKVFRADGTGYLFKSANTEPAASAVFSGELTVDDVEAGEELWAVYPFSDGATFDGEAITTVLPSDQVARPESFARNMNLSVARTTGNKLQFFNVGGGVRFSVTQEGVSKVIFEGLNGEILSGKVTIGFEEGVPVVKEVSGGSMFITLTPPEGETFQTGKWYYMVAIPGALEQGYKLRFYKGEDYAKRVSETPVTIKRAVFGSVAEADKGNEYESTTTVFPETVEEWEESESTTMNIATASRMIIDVSKELSDNNSPDPVFVATELTKIDGVLKAEPNIEEKTVTIVQDNGVYITLFLDLASVGETPETISTKSSSSIAPLTNTNSPIIPTSKKAVLFSPYQNSHYVNGKQKGLNLVDIDKVRQLLSEAGYTLTPYIDSEVSIEQMTGDKLLQYGVIIYVGHGGFRQPTTDGKILTTTLATGQEIGTISEEFEKKYRDKLALAIIDGSPRYSITVPWLEATTNACYSNSIVFIGACNSFRDDDLYNYFWDNGARSYLGFTYYTFYHLENEDQNQAKAVLYGFLEGLSFGASSKNSFMLHPKIIQNEYPFFTALINSFTASKWKGYSNVYLTYPKPYDLKHTINNNLVTFSWSNPPSSGQYKYYVYLNGSAYESQTTRGLTLQDLAPGSYNWYVQADLYYDGELYESYTSDGEPFTIGPSGEAKIKVSKTSLVFDDTKVGQTSTLDWTITNVGDGTLEVSSITVPDGFSTDFSSWSSKSLEPTASHTFKVYFKPTEAKQYSGKLMFKSNAVNAQNQGFTIGGKGVSTDVVLLQFDPMYIHFWDTEVGKTAQKEWTITNAGNVRMEVYGLSVPDGFSTDFSSWKEKYLSPGASHTFKIYFSPKHEGTYSGKMVLKSNTTGYPEAYCDISGDAYEIKKAIISVSTETINFGEKIIGETATSSVVITNKGNGNLDIFSCSSSGVVTTDYDTWDSTTIEPNGKRTLNIYFKPAEAIYYNLYIAIGSNASNVEVLQYINVTGTGVEPKTYSAEYVDLGLTVLWASCNLGAKVKEGAGYSYRWGENDTNKAANGWANYKWCKGTDHTLTKYCSDSKYGYNGFTDNKTVLEPADDAAYCHLGNQWHTPTDAEWTELREQCTWEKTSMNGVTGYKITSKIPGYTSKWIFLPTERTEYWSSTLATPDPNYSEVNPSLSWCISITKTAVYRSQSDRIGAYPIRPVRNR